MNIQGRSSHFNTNSLGYFQSANRGLSIYDCAIFNKLDDLRLSVMCIGEMVMNGAAVAVSLHATCECGSGQPNITYIAPLAIVVRTFKMIYYISFITMTLPRRGTVPHYQ